MLFIIGVLIATMVFSFLGFAVAYVVGNIMGFKLKYVRFFIWDISEMNGELICTTRKFSPLWQYAMLKLGLTEKEDIRYTVISLAIKSVIAVALGAICIVNGYGNFDMYEESLENFLMGIGLGLVFHTIYYFVYFLHYMITRKTRLMAFVKKIGKDYINGYPIEYMNLPPLESLNLKGNPFEKHMYQNYRFMQKLCQGSYQELIPIVLWTENNFEVELMKYETGSYYNLVFYYSYINHDLHKANKYFNAIKEELLNDMDSNGRRVLAYYQMYILRDPMIARATATDGLRVISQFSIGNAEKEFESKLLNNLINETMNLTGNVY